MDSDLEIASIIHLGIGSTFNYGRKLLILISGRILDFIRGNKNNATGTGDTEDQERIHRLKTITKGLDKINKAGIDIGTSGVGINRQINQ